jgi:hypothetical protein
MLNDQNHEPPLPRQTSEHGSPESRSVEGNQPPPAKRLDGEVTRQGDIPFAEGRYCEVWMGVWEKACGEGISKEDTKKVSMNLIVSIPLMRLSVGGLESTSDTQAARKGGEGRESREGGEGREGA